MTSSNGTQSAAEQNELLHFELTDEAFDELAGLEGSSVIGVSFWDNSMADELEEEPPDAESRSAFDIDFYLEDNVLLEVYGAAAFTSLEGDPVVGITALERLLVALIDREGVLDEVAETEDGGPVLVFAVGEQMVLLMAVGAWAVDEWEDLPEV